MHTQITHLTWRRRGAAHAARTPRRKRERRRLGSLSPGAARLRRLMKRRSHRHERRTVRAAFRVSTPSALAPTNTVTFHWRYP